MKQFPGGSVWPINLTPQAQNNPFITNAFKMYRLFRKSSILPVILAVGCLFPGKTRCQDHGTKKRNDMVISSTAFNNGEFIPSKYTCDGQNVSPDISWSGFPSGTKCFALICNDPDAPAGDWIHWVVANIPVEVRKFEENTKVPMDTGHIMVCGVNDFRVLNYKGPCPPDGIHRYYFRVFALDFLPDVTKGVSAADLKKKMKGHILAEGMLMGKYSRK
jgi:Raf kinase inhibitor-like YbhB/YbcL family protein